jgi:hypothetical protein
MVVKISSASDHLQDLKEAFRVMKAMNMKLNPTKSFFGLSGGKSLGFIVSERDIKIHPSKCQAITSMQPPKTAKEVYILMGHVAALTRFIARLGDACLPFFKTLK